MNHIPYPSIEQFRHTVHKVKCAAQYIGRDENDDPIYDESIVLPIISFVGTLKEHGTSSALAYNKTTNEKWFQSREQILTDKDNAGFASYFKSVNFDSLFEIGREFNEIVIFGEWVGKGIQSKVAVSQIPKTFIIFDVLVDGEFLPKEEVVKIQNHDIRVYNIYEFPTYNITIDFNKPEDSLDELVKITTEVADKCPVGLSFGVEGLGEGVVWRGTENWTDPKFFFKQKDERHQIKEIKPNEQNTKLQELANQLVPMWRLEQMLEKACDLNNGGIMDFKHISNYFKLVNADIEKEEGDVLKKEGVSFKEIAKYVAPIAKKFFVEKMNIPRQ